MLEFELSNEIKSLQSSMILGSLMKKEVKKDALPVIRIIFVGKELHSGIRDLFLACWQRHPVEDYIRASCDGKTFAAGYELLDGGMSVEYEMYLLSSDDESSRKRLCPDATVIVCAYGIASRKSRDWMEKVFLPEVMTSYTNIPVIVVATGIENRPPELKSSVNSVDADVESFRTAKLLSAEDTKAYAIVLQKQFPNIRSHVECSPITFKGFRTLANAGLAICLIGKVKGATKPKPGEELPSAGASAAQKLKSKEDEKCAVM
jgi:hypothetical protein